jgi:hypothetical protein
LNALGIDRASGLPLPAPDLASIAAMVRARGKPKVVQSLGLPSGMPADRLDKTGWAIVWADDVLPAVKGALEPLLEMRRREAGKRFAELNWQPQDSVHSWLKRHYAGTTVDPGKVPYYTLLVGSPKSIPFERQCELAASGYAVGRLDFGNDESAYCRYAEGIRAATDAPPSPRTIGFWAPRHDEATIASHDLFAAHLAYGEKDATEDWLKPASALHSFVTDVRLGGNAKKTDLLALFERAPALWVTASHGIGVAASDCNSQQLQGALLTQDWPGMGSPFPEQFVAGTDLTTAHSLLGSVGLLMACFGAGTPGADSFPWASEKDRVNSAAYYSGIPFVAALPQRLLSLDSGPALGLVAHVDRAYAMSFAPSAPGDRNGPFRTLLAGMMSGQRLGHAVADLSSRHAQLSAQLAAALAPDSPPIDARDLAATWLEQRDARNYLVLGDPAVRLNLEAPRLDE